MFRTDNRLGYYDPALVQRTQDLGAVDPFLLAAQGEAVALKIVEQMTPRQATALLQRIEESGLGEDEELSGLWDKIKKVASKVVKGIGKVAAVAAPVVTAAAGFVPLLAPVAGAVNVAAGVAQALSPQQIQQLQQQQAAAGPYASPQTFRMAAAEHKASAMLPILLLGGLLLLGSRRR